MEKQYPAIQKDFYRKKFEIRQKSLLHEDLKKIDLLG